MYGTAALYFINCASFFLLVLEERCDIFERTRRMYVLQIEHQIGPDGRNMIDDLAACF